MATIFDEIDLFDSYDIHKECTHRFILDYDGKIIEEDSTIEKKLCVCIYKNPSTYTGDYEEDEDSDEESVDSEYTESNKSNISKATWNYVSAGIRQSQNLFCRGELSSHFFNKEKLETYTDVIVTLSMIEQPSGASRHERIRLIGFVMCNDLKMHPDYSELVDTLYIDAICGNTLGVRAPPPVSDALWTDPVYNLNSERESHTTIKVGKIMLNMVEYYAISNGFEQMKLSALSYVINYYRNIGYTHTVGGDMLENPSIEKIATAVSKKKYKSEEDVDTQMRIERAIQLSDNSADKLKENLKLYLNMDTDTLPSDEKVTELLKKLDKSLTISNVKTDKGKDGIYDLLVKLTQLEFAPNCAGTEIPLRRNWLQMIDGEFVTKCIDEGFTMRKSLDDENGWTALIPMD